MKTILSIFVILALTKPLIAQQDSLKDVLPLKVGSKWKYSFDDGFRNNFAHSSSEDKGSVEYEIIGKSSYSLGIIWKVFQRRDFTRSSFISYNWHYEHIKDSSNFDIIEKEIGGHELYTPWFEQAGVLGIRNSAEDSSKFFRYVTADFLDTLKRQINFKDPSNPPPMYNHKYSYSLLKDTGIVKLIYSQFSGWGRSWAEYTLQEFHGVYDDPHLSLPLTNLSLITMTGTAKDTTIKINNDGLQSLLITDVVSDNQNFAVVNFSSVIEPRGEGFVTIRYNSSITGIFSGSLFINSNSINTSNTIYLTCNFYEEAIIATDRYDSFDFGLVINRTLSKMAYTIENKGNISLKFDSVKIDNNAYTNTFYSMVILPGQIIADTIFFSPHYTSQHQGTLSIFSNAKSSPKILYLKGSSSEETKVSFSRTLIDFGVSNVGVMKEETISISNYGKETIFIRRRMESGNCCGIHWPFNFGDQKWYASKEVKPGDIFSETLLFTPLNTEKYSDAVIYEFYVPNIGITKVEKVLLEGNIPYSIEQNYPNPFNLTTKIKFHIASHSDVTLKVFNSLGEEVVILVNENLNPGNYEKIFNAANLSSGIYFYRLQSKDFSQTRKFILLK